ncbi:hypothetical protein ELY21_11520 [Legionella sp. km535]|uniref:hypothetical protein n=1 Tax=Legionella sp. km535 TaxID=2498107 RepID=UPI000F8F1B94|nr:hypothetical protein [Legionella sp. km535]RUR17190.1 hypothetical protein ELY21_11520 [Legionella sp. km535]
MDQNQDPPFEKILIAKPLTKRSQALSSHDSNQKSLKVLDGWAKSQSVMQEISQILYPNNKFEKKLSFSNFNDVQIAVLQAKALYLSYRFCREEYTYFILAPIESFHDSRWSDKFYDARIRPILDKMDEIEKKHGLKDGHSWPAGKGPREYNKLSKEYDKIYEETFIETLREFDLNDLADLKAKKPREFDRLREHGRRIFHHKDATSEILRETVINYEKDAIKSSKAGAYLAGIIALAAALEGTLILICLKSTPLAEAAFKEIEKQDIKEADTKRNKKKGNAKDPTTWSFDTLIQVCTKAGWIQNIETENAVFNASEIAHLLRKMRNYVHPARQSKEKPWMVTSEKEYQMAQSIYTALVYSLDEKYNVFK